MKKLLLAVLIIFFPSFAWAQCTGVFPANTVCGTLATPGIPGPINFSSTLTGPGTTVVGDFATWNNTTGTLLGDVSPSALTEVNDTNVTMSLGGTPATAMFKAVSMTLGWTGQLSVARGGTGLASGTSGGIPYFSSTSTIASSGLLNSLILGGGAGASPVNYTGTTCTGNFVRSISNLGVATCQQINLTADVTGVLPIANGGTNAATQSAALINLMPTPVNTGDIAYWNGTIWTTLAGNTSGTQVLSENSSGAPSWQTISGTGTVTSITQGPGMTLSVTPCTTTCTITNAELTAPQGRLTLTANTPVMTTSVAAAGTLRYDCYEGSRVPYFDGTNDQIDTIASCEVTDAMVSAASAGQVVSNNIYDVWWIHGGASRICLAMSSASGGAGGWASDTGGTNTTRGTGYTQLDRITRPYITNKNSITNCFNAATNYGPIGANQATYIGTIYATANGQTGWVLGAFGAPPTAACLCIFNAYNRVDVATQIGETTLTWTYAVANTWREARGDTTFIIQVLRGVDEDGVSITNMPLSTPGTATATTSSIGLDSTTVPATGAGLGYNNTPAVSLQAVNAYSGTPGLGLHTFAPIEFNSSTTASTWSGFSANNFQTTFGIRTRM